MMNWKRIREFLSPGPRTDHQKALMEFSRSLTLIVDFNQLLENLVGKVREIVDVSNVVVLLKDAETGVFQVADCRGDKKISSADLTFSPNNKLIQWLTVNEIPLFVPENPGVMKFLHEEERARIKSLSIQVIVPLIVMNRLNGMVMLGEKRDKSPFAREELELMTTLLGQSALAFENAMLYQEQKNRLRKMFRADRLATIGQIAAGAAHEIRNPLTSIRSTIQYLKKKESDSDKTALMDEMLAEADRINEIIQGLLSFSKPMQPQKEEVDLAILLQQTLTLTASYARKNQVSIDFTPPKEAAIIEADLSQLKQVFLNIELNAIQAMENGGSLSIKMDRAAGKGKAESSYMLKFADTGSGIPDEALEQIFDPFFTTKKEGTGLGLSISYGIIRQHGGDIEIHSASKGKRTGTTVSVRLPIKTASVS